MTNVMSFIRAKIFLCRKKLVYYNKNTLVSVSHIEKGGFICYALFYRLRHIAFIQHSGIFLCTCGSGTCILPPFCSDPWLRYLSVQDMQNILFTQFPASVETLRKYHSGSCRKLCGLWIMFPVVFGSSSVFPTASVSDFIFRTFSAGSG